MDGGKSAPLNITARYHRFARDGFARRAEFRSRAIGGCEAARLNARRVEVAVNSANSAITAILDSV